jgi:hypothetical protein
MNRGLPNGDFRITKDGEQPGADFGLLQSAFDILRFAVGPDGPGLPAGLAKLPPNLDNCPPGGTIAGRTF